MLGKCATCLRLLQWYLCCAVLSNKLFWSILYMNSVHNMVLQYHWPTYIHSLLSYLQARHVSGSFNLFSTVPADVSGKCLTIMLCTWSVFWGALVPLPYEPSSFLGAQYVPLNHSAVVVLLWFGKRKDLSPPADSFPCFSIVCGMVCYKEGKHMDQVGS